MAYLLIWFGVAVLAALAFGPPIKEMGDQNSDWVNEIPDGWVPPKPRLVSSHAKKLR